MTDMFLILHNSMDFTFWLSLYVVAGLITLLILIHIARKDEDDYEDISRNLGQLVIYALLAWPYIFVLWIFFSPIWLKKL